MPQLDFNIWFINGMYLVFFFFVIYLLSFRYIILPLIKLFYARFFFVDKNKKRVLLRESESKIVLSKNLLGFEYYKSLNLIKNLSIKFEILKKLSFKFAFSEKIQLDYLESKFIIYLISIELFGLVKNKVLNEVIK